MSAAVDTTVDDDTAAAIDFGAGAWSRGGHLEPPGEVTDTAARNLWRMTEGATREAVAVLDPAAADRDPSAARVTSEALVVIVARALVVGEQQFAYSIADASAALELAQSIVDEAVRRLERDSVHREPNGHDKRDEEPSRAGRFTLIDDTAIESQPATPWRIHRMLQVGGLWVLVGPPGSFKTFLALSIAFSVALGRKFHGREVRPGPVVYVAAEGSGGLGLRVRALKRALGVAGRAGVLFLTEAVQLNDSEQVAAFIDAVTPVTPALIIFDTLNRNIAGSDENSATEMGVIIQTADYIRQRTSADVGFLHHTTKAGNVERGSSVIRGACDTMMLVTRDDDIVTVSAEKVKEAEAFADLHFRAKVIELEDGETSCVLEPIDDAYQARPAGRLPASRQLALDVLRDQGSDGATFADWRRAFPKAESTFQRCVRDLKAWGHVVQRKSRYFVAGGSNATV